MREKTTPLNRFVQPEEEEAAAVFLASDDAAAIAGRSLVIDGGFQNGLLQPVERMLSKTGVESREWRRERSGGLNLLDGGKEIVPALS